MVNIYCDGGCSGNQNEKNIGGWGVVLIYKEHIKELSGGEYNTTNNRMELTALIEGLKAIIKPNHIVNVYSDSAYIVNCFHQKWHVNWQKNNWKNAKKQPVENKVLWQALLQLIARHPKVNFYKIKGHLDIKDEAKIRKWHTKFEVDYKINMPYALYLKGVEYNNRADALANMAMDKLR